MEDNTVASKSVFLKHAKKSCDLDGNYGNISRLLGFVNWKVLDGIDAL